MIIIDSGIANDMSLTIAVTPDGAVSVRSVFEGEGSEVFQESGEMWTLGVLVKVSLNGECFTIQVFAKGFQGEPVTPWETFSRKTGEMLASGY